MEEKWRANEGEEVFIGAPAVPMAAQLFERLKHVVEADPRILFACVPQMYLRGKIDPPAQVLCLVFREPSQRLYDQVIPALTARMRGEIGEGKHIDIFPLSLDHDWLPTIVNTGCILAVNDPAAFSRFA